MPTHKSAAKRMKTAEKARLRNKGVKTILRSVVKTARSEKDPAKNIENLKNAFSTLDKAAQKRVIHKNKAARTKSRLAKAANKKQP